MKTTSLKKKLNNNYPTQTLIRCLQKNKIKAPLNSCLMITYNYIKLS